MWIAIEGFTKALEELPGWREWQRSKIQSTLFFDDVMPGEETPPIPDFPTLPPEMESQPRDHTKVPNTWADGHRS